MATKLPATIAITTSATGSYSEVTAVVTFADSSTATFKKGFTGGATLPVAMAAIEEHIATYLHTLGLNELPSSMKLNAKGKIDDLSASGLHTHSIANVTGLQTALDLKGNIVNTDGAAKTASAAIAEKTGTVRLGSGGVLAMTLADPTNATDDGKRLTVVASTAHAHVITVTGGLAGGALNTLTFGGAVGDMVELEAVAGKWFLRPSINVPASTV